MPIETTTGLRTTSLPQAGDGNWARALLRGLKLRCPSCNQRTMFAGYITVADTCSHCGEELHHHRADDAPPYFAIFIAGHIIIPAVLLWERFAQPPMWLQAAVWLPLSALIMVAILPLTKGALVGLQWALGMHGFGATGGVSDNDPNHDPNRIEFGANGSVRQTE